MKNDFCQLWLTTGSKAEADKISKVLLDKRLVACVRQIPVNSDFWWRGQIDHASEILLLMESSMVLFNKIETEVKKLHTYDTFILEATPISRISKSAEEWLSREMHGNKG